MKHHISAEEQQSPESLTPSTITTTDFLDPIVERMQVTQYGDEATVVIHGKQLWFSHSIKIASLTEQSFQTQEAAVRFSVNVRDISEFFISNHSENKEVSLYSYFTQPVTKKVPVEVNVSPGELPIKNLYCEVGMPSRKCV